jgi:hypothetical protein
MEILIAHADTLDIEIMILLHSTKYGLTKTFFGGRVLAVAEISGL